MALLPSETMLDILSRMPLKSLARSRCVNKQWCNYINDSYLETMRAKRGSNDRMLILFNQFPSISSPNSSCTHSFLEYKDEEGICALDVRKKPPVMEFMCSGWGIRHPNHIILGSCNGLLYSSHQDHHGYNTLVVIHPLKKESYVLPPIKTPFHSLRSWGIGLDQEYLYQIRVEGSSGLGFDESANTFKMVSVMTRKRVNVCTMVHVLGTDSWRKIPQVPCYPIAGEGVFAKGCLHWLIRDEDDDERDTYLGRPVITFDMVKEEFGLINPPQERPSDTVIKERLVDLDGEVGYAYNIVNNRVEVWVLKERGWVMHCEFEQKPPLPRGFVKVLGLWNEDGDILLIDNTGHMFVYNLRSDSLNEVNLVGSIEGPAIDIRVYRSSLFSSRYSMKKR